MAVNSLLIMTFAIGILIVLISLLMKYFKQPYVIAYILAGVLLGGGGFNLIKNPETLSSIGSMGVVLLLFFVGMEMSLPKILSNWKIAILGTLGQIILTTALSILLGHFLNWSLERSILISFVIVVSSTAVIIKILETGKEIHTKVGQNALAITIIHDIAVIPMMLILTLFSKTENAFSEIYLQIIGGLFFTALIIYALQKSPIHLPFSKTFQNDHELQVFAAIIFCLGLSIISESLGLSAALGAFVAGILISSTDETKWVSDSLHPFKIVFLSLFFVYIGLLIDVQFIIDNYLIISLWVIFIFIINTAIVATILVLLKNTLRESIYVGAILAQAGEFGFVLVAIGTSNKIISIYDYNLAISIISLTLLFSPLWIVLIKKIMAIDKNYIKNLRKKYFKQIEKINKKN